MVELMEDGPGEWPGVVCGVWLAGGVVGVAEAVEDFGFVVAVAKVAEQLKRALVAGGGLLVSAEVVSWRPIQA
ncbi:hypothetical protein RB614_30505 [Phytohabitans sp. ZYX-F-186]|uniref:Uncharacterized protein n=1 Tax=Phytohabitans maris TaxID=3071409 RepID=A0ABU0ZSE9_9ACTN|nr:hypothetical protein [Phytohabitans sp. ZYX-F-186]MDQ7908872.1 hypothetical protein [Phytohabitans sp. ZYX-F-186]